ncbi:MAG: DUF928 domain-containing protein [Cyanobacteria bacterium Co-bin13]|nr:DUF928 domain-containing protein [Cyanobacteria bacterium Co-bin13]
MMVLKAVKNHRVLSGLGAFAGFAAVLTGMMSAALAGYVPPADADAPTSRSTSGGRRGGCQGAGDIDLVALAPQHHIGQTMSSHPTVAWFVPADIRQPLELELYEKGESGQWQRLSTFTLEEGPAGIMTFTWPESEPGLEVGQTYRWQVISTCVVGLPSRDLVTTAELQVVAPEEASTPATANPVETAQRYAEAGLWYDALALVAGPSLPALATYRNELLLDLAALEAASAGDEEIYLSTQLRRIVAAE